MACAHLYFIPDTSIILLTAFSKETFLWNLTVDGVLDRVVVLGE